MQLQTLFKAMSTVPLFVLAACSGGLGAQDQASAYPQQTVRFLVPYSAGGPTDVGARALVPCLEQKVGGTWIVENKDGAAGALAMLEIASATPDGHVVGVGSQSTFVTTPLIEKSAGYKYQDYDYAGQMMQFPSVILVPADSPYRTIEDLLAAAKRPGSDISMGTSGSQVSFSLATQQLIQRGMGFTVVPFDGTSEANTAVLGGNVDVRWEAADTTTMELVESGKLRPLATGASERLSFLPDVPTLAEVGVTDLLDTTTFYGVVGPDGLDPAIKKTLTNGVRSCVSSDSFVQKVGGRYATYIGEKQLTERLSAYQDTVSQLVN